MNIEKINKLRKKAGRTWDWLYGELDIPKTSFRRKVANNKLTDKQKALIVKLLSK